MKNKNILIILIVVVIFSISCNLPIGDRAADSPPAPISNEGELPVENQMIFSYDLSDEQLIRIAEHGYPTRFKIIFGENDRQETWFYDTLSYSFVFLNGNIIADKDTIVQYHENMYATTYLPDQFTRGMGLEEILATTGKTEFIISEIEGMDRDMHLIHLEGLSIGLLEGKLSFVETYPAMTERKLTPEDFNETKMNILTEEEIANTGEHKYLVVFYLDGDLVNEVETTIRLTFENDTLIIEENNVENRFYRIEPNNYESNDGTINTFINLEGFVSIIEEENGTVEVIYSRLD